MAEPTVFDKIIDGSIPSWKIWEDDAHLAFLTPFANTPGQTVVIPKINPGDDLFNMSDEEVAALMLAAKKVVRLLESGLGVSRVALVVEGTGVAHVHIKLFPLHGDKENFTSQIDKHQEYYPEYAGYITTVEGPKMADEKLNEVQQKIQAAAA